MPTHLVAGLPGLAITPTHVSQPTHQVIPHLTCDFGLWPVAGATTAKPVGHLNKLQQAGRIDRCLRDGLAVGDRPRRDRNLRKPVAHAPKMT